MALCFTVCASLDVTSDLGEVCVCVSAPFLSLCMCMTMVTKGPLESPNCLFWKTPRHTLRKTCVKY